MYLSILFIIKMIGQKSGKSEGDIVSLKKLKYQTKNVLKIGKDVYSENTIDVKRFSYIFIYIYSIAQFMIDLKKA